MTRPPFPSVIDSSMLSAWRACPHKFRREYLEHWKPRNPSVHLVAGGAFAKGLEVARLAYYAGVAEVPVREGAAVHWAQTVIDPGQRDLAIELGLQALITSYGTFECPPDSAKSCERTAAAFVYYLDEYCFGADMAEPVRFPSGKYGIEFSFAEPLAIAHPTTGDPILFCGRFDMVVNFAGGVFGLDDKTTSSLGAQWADQWHMRSQFTAYCWGARRAGIPIQGFLVRGCAILKTKFDTQQAVTYRPQWMIDRWERQTLADIASMIEAWQRDDFSMNLDASCEAYGGCPFKRTCLVEDAAPWLAQDFERRRWNPLVRQEEAVE